MNTLFDCKTIIVTAIFILCNLPASRAQEDLDSILNRMEQQLDHYRQEKLYVHTDKAGYVSGDTLWFRCYLTEADSHKEINTGFSIRLQLINPEEKMIMHTVIRPGEKGYTGYMPLSRGLAEGEYLLRAFAYNRSSTDPGCYFSRKIRISNLLSALIKPAANFAFGKDGQKITATLTLSDPRTGVMINPKNINLDYGNVSLPVKTNKGVATAKIPAEGNNRPLLVQYGDWEQFIPIPSVEEGYNVSFFPEGGNLLEETECKVGFKAFDGNGRAVEISGEIVDEQNRVVTQFQTLYNGTGCFKLTPRKGQIYKAVCRNHAGMAREVRLPEPTGQAYCLSARWNNNHLDIHINGAGSLSSDAPLFLLVHTRGNVHYFDELKPGNAGLSIHKKHLQSGVMQILLLDAQMEPLSQRVVYCKKNDQAQTSFSTETPVYRGGEPVKGVITVEDMDHRPVNGTVSIAVTDDYDVRPDTLNSLRSALLLLSELAGTVESPEYYFIEDFPPAQEAMDALMLTQEWGRYDIPAALQDRSPVAELPDGPRTVITVLSSPGNDSAAVEKAALRYQKSHGEMLTYGTPRKKSREIKTVKGISNADHSVTADEIRKYGYLSLAEALRNVPGIVIESDNKIYLRNLVSMNLTPSASDNELRIEMSQDGSFVSESNDNSANSQNNITNNLPRFILDGIHSELSVINTIPMEDIQRIDVYKRGNGLIYGMSGGGVISVSTKKSSFANLLSGQAKAENEKNTIGKTAAQTFPDMRSTIYWNPVVPIIQGKGEINFVTSEGDTSSYTVTIEGISDEGLIIHRTAKIRINK